MQRIGEATPALPPLPTCGPGWGGSRSPHVKEHQRGSAETAAILVKLCSKLVPCPWVSARGQVGETTGTGLPGAWGGRPIAQSCHRCCWAHDCCYKKLKHHGCGTKFLNYNVSIRRGQITCGKSKSYRLHPASSALFPVFACQAPELDTKGHLPNPGIKPGSPALHADSLPSS